MFEKLGIFCDRWQTFVHDVTDWTPDTPEKEKRATAQIIPAGLNGPVKTRPVADPNDSNYVVCGSAVETLADWTSYFECYRINNKRWEFFNRSYPLVVPEKVQYVDGNGRAKSTQGIIQPAIWVDDCENLNAFFRSSGGLDNLYYHGQDTEQYPTPTNLPNPNSSVDVATVGDRLFLASNPSSSMRFPLVVQEIEKVSNTEFKVIDEISIREDIDEGESPQVVKSFSYPYMIEHNGQLHLVYTYGGRKKIEYVVINV